MFDADQLEDSPVAWLLCALDVATFGLKTFFRCIRGLLKNVKAVSSVCSVSSFNPLNEGLQAWLSLDFKYKLFPQFFYLIKCLNSLFEQAPKVLLYKIGEGIIVHNTLLAPDIGNI